MPSPVSYVLFDMDGLMIDSEQVYTDVTNEILKPYGAEMTWAIKAGLMGKPERAAAEHLLASLPGLPLSTDEYIRQRTILQDLRWPHVRLLPGVERLVRHLHTHGVPTAIATGSQRRNFVLKTGHLQDVFGLFGRRVVCGDDAWIAREGGRGKPAPDVFLVAARALGRSVGEKGPDGEREGGEVGVEERAERARGLVFEDALPGVRAGKRAGMNVIWVPDPNLLGVEDTNAEKADEVLRSLAEFVPEEWGLPPYDSDGGAP
ncbi:HAD-like protein [Vararia minispora EC-137]|uniref:HAD-like protein n=1 Tax=Vararia minispora EC-137 TaxID=1314806 RepID=A0ACB8QGL6_9AGAM|nr:HAD-like protein [Vararia minispora EC-137]